MTPEQMYEQMVEIYGDKLPDLDHCPIQFAYFVKMYKYFHLKETQ